MLYVPLTESYKQFWNKVLLIITYLRPELTRKERYNMAINLMHRRR